MNYPSIRIEGAILSPDILDKLEDAVGQRPSDFGFDRSSKVKDEIARAWADAQDYWRIFQRKLEAVKAGSPAPPKRAICGWSRCWVCWATSSSTSRAAWS